MKKCLSLVFVVSLCLLAMISQAAVYHVDDTMHVRFGAGFGPRYLSDEMMSNSRWDTAMELSMGVYKHLEQKNIYAGVEARANTSWDSRFNSVNDDEDFFSQTLLVHNSASMELMAFVGREFNDTWSGEVAAGAQLSWVKWLNSPQEATDDARILPKLRLSVNRKLNSHAKTFFAVSHAFNHYGSLACDNGQPDCFNDEGFASTTDAKVGLLLEF